MTIMLLSLKTCTILIRGYYFLQYTTVHILTTSIVLCVFFFKHMLISSEKLQYTVGIQQLKNPLLTICYNVKVILLTSNFIIFTSLLQSLRPYKHARKQSGTNYTVNNQQITLVVPFPCIPPIFLWTEIAVGTDI